jgi:hypothetical protein
VHGKRAFARTACNHRAVKFSTVAIIGVVLVAAGFGAYKLGHGVDKPAQQLATVAVGIPQQAAVATAESNLSGAVSAASQYQTEHGGYTGMSTGSLRTYDAALSGNVKVQSAAAGGYCIESTVDGTTVSVRGPNGSYVVGPC